MSASTYDVDDDDDVMRVEPDPSGHYDVDSPRRSYAYDDDEDLAPGVHVEPEVPGTRMRRNMTVLMLGTGAAALLFVAAGPFFAVVGGGVAAVAYVGHRVAKRRRDGRGGRGGANGERRPRRERRDRSRGAGRDRSGSRAGGGRGGGRGGGLGRLFGGGRGAGAARRANLLGGGAGGRGRAGGARSGGVGPSSRPGSRSGGKTGALGKAGLGKAGLGKGGLGKGGGLGSKIAGALGGKGKKGPGLGSAAAGSGGTSPKGKKRGGRNTGGGAQAPGLLSRIRPGAKGRAARTAAAQGKAAKHDAKRKAREAKQKNTTSRAGSGGFVHRRAQKRHDRWANRQTRRTNRQARKTARSTTRQARKAARGPWSRRLRVAAGVGAAGLLAVSGGWLLFSPLAAALAGGTVAAGWFGRHRLRRLGWHVTVRPARAAWRSHWLQTALAWGDLYLLSAPNAKLHSWVAAGVRRMLQLDQFSFRPVLWAWRRTAGRNADPRRARARRIYWASVRRRIMQALTPGWMAGWGKALKSGAARAGWARAYLAGPLLLLFAQVVYVWNRWRSGAAAVHPLHGLLPAHQNTAPAPPPAAPAAPPAPAPVPAAQNGGSAVPAAAPVAGNPWGYRPAAPAPSPAAGPTTEGENNVARILVPSTNTPRVNPSMAALLEVPADLQYNVRALCEDALVLEGQFVPRSVPDLGYFLMSYGEKMRYEAQKWTLVADQLVSTFPGFNLVQEFAGVVSTCYYDIGRTADNVYQAWKEHEAATWARFTDPRVNEQYADINRFNATGGGSYQVSGYKFHGAHAVWLDSVGTQLANYTPVNTGEADLVIELIHFMTSMTAFYGARAGYNLVFANNLETQFPSEAGVRDLAAQTARGYAELSDAARSMTTGYIDRNPYDINRRVAPRPQEHLRDVSNREESYSS